MSRIVDRTLSLKYDADDPYISDYVTKTSSDLYFNVATVSSGNIAFEAVGKTELFATFNSAAMDVLYPNSTISPVSATISARISSYYFFSKCYGYTKFYFDDTQVYSGSYKPSGYEYDTVTSTSTASAVTNSTKSSTLKIGMYCEKAGSAFIQYVDTTLSFQAYDMSATGENCVATVSEEYGFDGDTITFSCTLDEEQTFLGWYSGSTLVSSSQTYNHTVNGADLTLVAKATAIPVKFRAKYLGENLFTVLDPASTAVVYDGRTIATLEEDDVKTLECGGKVMRTNITAAGKTILCDATIMKDNIIMTYGNEIVGNNLCFTAEQANSVVSMTQYSSASSTQSFNVTLQYSTNQSTWNTFTPGTTSITLTAVGDKVYFRGSNTTFYKVNSDDTTDYYGYKFNITGQVGSSGSIMSLLDGMGESVYISSPYCFYKLFDSCNISSAPTLPATTLTENCYESLFLNCTLLTTPPALPATTLAEYCYYDMFDGSGITTAPTLSATTLDSYCYAYMFKGCTSLTAAPALPATSLTEHCYDHMFAECTALVTAPVISATSMAKRCCYDMFSECNALVVPPTLPATTLAEACYMEMFEYCTSIINAPALPATTLETGCYVAMFTGCSALTGAPTISATTLATDCCELMFCDCTALAVAPTLPTDNDAWTYCYSEMFKGCTSLTTPPALPAKVVWVASYFGMFSGCTSLYVSDTQTSTASHAWIIPSTGTCENLITVNMNDMFKSCAGSRSSDGATFSSGTQLTYYTQNTPV